MSYLNSVTLVGFVGATRSSVKRVTTVRSLPFFPSPRSAPGKTRRTNGPRKPSGTASALQRIAEVAGEYVTKGRPVLVEGRLQTRTWTDRDEIERTTFEVVVRSLHLLDRAPNGEERLGSAARTENEIPEGEETPY